AVVGEGLGAVGVEALQVDVVPAGRVVEPGDPVPPAGDRDDLALHLLAGAVGEGEVRGGVAGPLRGRGGRESGQRSEDRSGLVEVAHLHLPYGTDRSAR